MNSKLSDLPLAQKIGQLFFIGLPGVEFDDKTRDILEQIKPGGLCLFARNIRESEQTRKLINKINDLSETLPFISLDQEGGLVDRLRRLVEPMPAASSLKNAEQAKLLAEITSKIIRMLGFNMNFAPVVDVKTAERGHFSNGLVSRTFGNTKEEVVDFAINYLDRLQSNGVIGCLKHFPGLGATEIDSHEDLPVVNLDFETLNEIDLYPYFEMIKTGSVKLIMSAHAAFPLLDLQERDQNGKLLPSSLSYNFTTKLLRDHLGFDGLTVTDDMEMGAILKNYGIGEACRMAVKAGQNMLAICNQPEVILAGYTSVLSAVKSGEIDENIINDSLQRISTLKDQIQPPIDFDKDYLAELSDEIVALKAQLK